MLKIKIMAWQKCPVCEEDTGKIVDCVCKGTRLIDTVTGLPPVKKSEDNRAFNKVIENDIGV